MTEYNPAKTEEYLVLVYTTQVNSSFRVHWLTSSEENSKFYSSSSSQKKIAS